MNSHPAYGKRRGTRTILGMISSIVEIDGRALCLRISMDAGSISGWIEPPPNGLRLGQVHSFVGKNAFFEEFGEQFLITSYSLSSPDLSVLPTFLAHHVPGLSSMRARRLVGMLGISVFECLQKHDVKSMAFAIGGAKGIPLAELVFRHWDDYSLHSKISEQFLGTDFPESHINSIAAHYGTASLAKIADNPYRLVSFAEFHLVDNVAQELYGIPPTDTRRLLGLVDAAVYRLFDQNHLSFTRAQLAATMNEIADVSNQAVGRGIDAAISIDRLIAVDSVTFIGDAFNQMQESVFAFLRWHVNADLLAGATVNGNAPSPEVDVQHIADRVLRHSISAVTVDSMPSALAFISTLLNTSSPSFSKLFVVAGNAALSSRITEKCGITCAHFDRPSDFSSLDEDQYKRPRAILIVGATIDVIAFARLLPHLRETDHLIFIGQNLPYANPRELLLPALLALLDFPHYVLPPTLTFCESPLDAMSRKIAGKREYNSRYSDSRGVFWLSVSTDQRDTAIAGISHQLLLHGSVIVATSAHAVSRVDSLLTKALSPSERKSITVSAVDALEPESGDSCLVALDEAHHDSTWCHATLASARIRTVFFSSSSGGEFAVSPIAPNFHTSLLLKLWRPLAERLGGPSDATCTPLT